MKITFVLSALAVSLTTASPHLLAQSSPSPRSNTPVVQTFSLANPEEARESNEVISALRNILDTSDKLYLIPSQNLIVISAPVEQIQLAQKLLADLDRPKKSYRLTYTVTDTDAGKRVGVQHFSMMVLSGQRTTLKQGSKVPIVTGTYTPTTTTQNTQITYLDIGLNFDATLDEFANGLRLRSKAEQSSIAQERLGGGLQDDPIVRQSVLEGTAILTPGKSLVLGSLDVPGSTRHLDVEVMAEVVK